jgi:iron uptake system EfeUOB component EfeO/EfeM
VITAGLAALALAVPISGCGHTASVGADRTLRVALSEYRVVPQKVQVSAGQLTIIVHNLGKLVHNLVVLRGDQRVDETQPIWPGTVSEMSVDLAPGQYTIASTLFSDQALGEYGSLTVGS